MPYSKTQISQATSLVKRAEATRSPARKIIRALCDTTNTPYSSSVLEGPQKTLTRILEKAATDYGGDVSKVRDPTRFMYLFNDAAIIPIFRSVLFPGKKSSVFNEQLTRTGFQFSKGSPKDLIDKPKRWGYMAIIAKFEPLERLKHKYTPFELQITHSGLQSGIYPQTHERYEGVRVKIEAYDKAETPFQEWAPEVKAVVKSILALHYTGAAEYDMLPYISAFPTLQDVTPEDPEDDIPDETYEPSV